MIILTSPAEILESASSFVLETLANSLDNEILFHNQRHTVQCVHAVQEIGEAVELSSKENLSVQLAAWFINLGYIQSERKVLDVSVEMMTEFMRKHEVNDLDLNLAIACIRAIAHDHPSTLPEAVMHDAYWYFLSASNHLEMCDRLRAEFLNQDQKFDDLSWRDYVCDLYKNERYVTHYGRSVLEKRKQVNYYMCLTRLYGVAV